MIDLALVPPPHDAYGSLNQLLAQSVEMGASDVHLTVGIPPWVRVHGSLTPLPEWPDLRPEDTQRLVRTALKDEHWQRFARDHEMDLGYAVAGVSRFRVNVYRQRGSVGAVFRVIPQTIPRLDGLGLPLSIERFAHLSRGLVLITGPTGSGKSTTLASLIDVANRTRTGHIVTIEDPIEYLHSHQRCLVNQREVGVDTADFSIALKQAMRQDPDIIMLGELRDLETTSVAVTAAETGHLVLATLHTQSAAQTVDRLIDVYPAHQQGQVRNQLANCLQGVVTQALAPRKDGKGSVAITEVMVANTAIRNLIRDGKGHQIPSVIHSSGALGMIGFDQSLANSLLEQLISKQTALDLRTIPSNSDVSRGSETMPAVKTFLYEAVDSSGTVRRGTIGSESADAVAVALRGQKLVPLTVSASGAGLRRELTFPGLGKKRTSVRDLAVFARQFASMTSSGLTLTRALTILEEQTDRAGLKAAVSDLQADVQAGSSLSKAMSRHPEQFPALMVNMVGAGETGGFLDDALDRIAKMYEADAALRAKIKSALTYPVIVLIFSLLMGIGVIVFIVPIFEDMFSQLGGSLPLPTAILVSLSDNAYWLLPLVVLVVAVALRGYRRSMRSSESFRLKVDRLKPRIPVFGKLYTKLAIARWARNLSTLLAVGVPVVQALDIVGGTSGNALIGAAMVDVRQSVRTGSTISAPLAASGIFPSMVVQMLQVGEETGQMSEMLGKVADYYDQEVETATDGLTSALEPLLVVLMGLVIGTMVICLYLPMFTIYENIQSS